MRPIDTIREKLDHDLIKYHNSSLCVIPTEADIKDFKGVGIMALVVPINEYDIYEQKINETKSYNGKLERYPVVIVNRMPGWMESDMASKYNVLILNPVQDRVGCSIGFLVPKTIYGTAKAWAGMTTEDGDSIESLTVDNNSKGEKG